MKMDAEKRKALARKARESMNKNMTNNSFKKVDRIDWKKEGKALVYLYPGSETGKRWRHWLPIEIEKDEVNAKTKKKRKIKTLIRLPFNCPGPDDCAACKFRARVSEDSGIDVDQPVLSFGHGAKKEIYVKGEVMGLEAYGFKKSLKGRCEFVTVGVEAEDASGVAPKDPKPMLFCGPPSLGEKIIKAMDNVIDEYGEEKGNPHINPYPFKLTYNKGALPNDQYDARPRLTFKPTDAVKAALDLPPPDISSELKTDGDRIAKIIDGASLLVEDGGFDAAGDPEGEPEGGGDEEALEEDADGDADSDDGEGEWEDLAPDEAPF